MVTERKSISESMKKGFGSQIGLYLRSGWTFDKWYEKLILVGLVYIALSRIYGWIF